MAVFDELRRHWKTLLLGLAMYAVGVASYSFLGTLTLDSVIDEFGVSVGEVSAVLGIVQILRVPLLMISGTLIDVIGPIFLVCSGLGGLGCLCLLMGSSFSSTIDHYYALRIATFLIGPLTDQPAHICLQSSYFAAAQPIAVSIINAGYSIAGASLSMPIALIVSAYGWRSAWLVVGAVGVVFSVLGALTLRPGPLPVGSRAAAVDPSQQKEQAKEQAQLSLPSVQRAAPPAALADSEQQAQPVLAGGIHLTEALIQPAFWALLLAAFCTLYWEGTMTNHLLLMMRLDGGKSLTQASALYSLEYAFAICGKVSCGALVKVAPRRLLFLFAPVAFWCAHLLLLEPAPLPSPTPSGFASTLHDAPAFAPAFALPSHLRWLGVDALRVTRSSARLGVFVCVYGLGFGLTHSLINVQPAHLFGRVRLPYFQTLVFATTVLGSSAGQIVSGRMYDVAHSYALPLMLTFCVSALNVLACQVVGCAPSAEEREQISRARAWASHRRKIGSLL